MSRNRLIISAVGGLAATALAGGIAVAAIPSGDGVIHGCYQKNQGQLRVLDAESEACRPSELAISWNQAGAQGLQGVQGPQGQAGAQGEPGPQGERGPAGAGFTWRGAFECDASYAPGDVVSHLGSSWITALSVGGCVDPPHEPWQQLAAKGERGAEGPEGPPGPPGPNRPDRVHSQRYTYVYGSTKSLGSHEGFDVGVTCPAGTAAISGGYSGHGVATDGSFADANGWHVTGGAGLLGGHVQPFAVCSFHVVEFFGP